MNNDDTDDTANGPFAGHYGTAGLGGNSADGGDYIHYTGYDGYWYAINKYVDLGYSVPVSQINSIALHTNIGVGDTNTDQLPCTYYLSVDGSNWTSIGTANGGYNPPASLTLTRS